MQRDVNIVSSGPGVTLQLTLHIFTTD